MHPPAARAEAEKLIAAGVNDCEISRRTGIPRATIRDWRRPSYVRKIDTQVCPRCWESAKPIWFSSRDYAELLGLYLGDGCVSPGPRAYRLRISLDEKYPSIIEDTRALLDRCMPDNRVDVVGGKSTKGKFVNVSTYSRHWPCLLPQHGPGKKHLRAIQLERWQVAHLDAEPWAFLRGLIRSDGCVFINITDARGPGPYEYLSYSFSNKSADICRLFCESCERVGVDYRCTFTRSRRLWQVRINRRASVARMLARIGVKA